MLRSSYCSGTGHLGMVTSGLSRLRELVAINRAIVSTLDYCQLLDLVVERTSAFTGADACVLLLGEGGQPARVAASAGICGSHTHRFAAPLDEQIGPALRGLVDFDNPYYVAAPIIARGQIEGMLAVFWKAQEPPHGDEEFLLSALADQAAIALEHARSYEKLKEDEERFRLLVQEVKDYAIFMLDPQGCVVSWNLGAERIKGWRSEEIIGRHFSCFYGPDEIARGEPEAVLRRASTQGRAEIEGWLLRKDGSRFFASVVITSLRDASDGIVGFSIVLRDITNRVEWERELVAARDVAIESARLKSAFLANISHEIRSPLNLVLGACEIAAEALSGTAEATAVELISNAHSAGQRLLSTIDAVLDLSKMDANAFHPQPAAVNLPGVVKDRIGEFAAEAQSKGVKLSMVIESPSLTVLCDERCLATITRNLIDNAVKFTERGEVTVSVYESAEGIALAVHDTGIGIDPAYMPRLFEPFSQESSGYRRSFEGAGLGLAIVKRYVEINGARIEVCSKKGEGSIFTIYFPPTHASAVA